jgi:hypothetical protein
VFTIVAPLALIVVAGGVGATLGLTGVLAPEAVAEVPTLPQFLVDDAATAYVCPGGPAVSQVAGGTRVLAVARDADGAFLGVRNPDDWDGTLWFATADLVLDGGGVDPAGLPVGECPVVDVEVVTPAPQPTQEPEPDPTDDPQPQPPADSTPPVVTSLKANKTLIINGETVTLSFASTDNVGVTKVVLSWSNGSVSGNVALGANGNYNWSNQSFANNTFGKYTFTAVAYDAAGNQSAPVSVIVDRQYLG